MEKSSVLNMLSSMLTLVDAVIQNCTTFRGCSWLFVIIF